MAPEQRALRNAKAEAARRTKHWESVIAKQARHDAKVEGYVTDIDEAFVLQLFAQQRGLCHWLGVPMVPSVTRRDPQRPSMDRLDCSRGYFRDNVVLSCSFANIGRRDTTVERFEEFLRAVGFERPAKKVAA